MSNESMHQGDYPYLDGRPSLRAVAFERLIDQLAPGPGHVPPEERAARRLCGRWLLLRRAARQLSCADVAERTGLSEGALELLEQGLVGPAPGAEEGWLRLGLVLERHGENDLQRVAAAIAVARGAAAGEAALLAGIASELAAPEEEPAPAPARVPPAETAQELIDILAAVSAGGDATTAYRIKKAVAELGGKSWNPADLPRTLAAMARDGLVSRAEGRPASYRLTQAGAEILALAAERERAREDELRAQAVERQAQAAIAVRLRPLTGEI